ncbi:MAG: ABC transporter permease [Zoogloeaceae bacterium]|jgi:putative ABC transport system permease protein|nr:ABC transporter permease [Zoogloeaceae bacterium]
MELIMPNTPQQSIDSGSQSAASSARAVFCPLSSVLCLHAIGSAWNRRGTLVFTVLAIALAVTLILGIERLRADARASFLHSVTGVDLVVGARTGPVQLMLYSVFRMGGATHDIGYESVQWVMRDPAVAWAVPLALGDSLRGFPVIGTTPDYFRYFRFGTGGELTFAEGRAFGGDVETLYEAVPGAEVAARLGLKIGDAIVLAHGSGENVTSEHADKPFRIAGVLAATGTPVDRSVHVSLAAIEAIHLDWQGGAPTPGFSIPADMARKFDLTPRTVTAILVGLKSRTAVFQAQRRINAYRDEPLMAVLPGVALDELWQIVGLAARALSVVSFLAAATGLAGLTAVILASLNERRRELAILRANGARPRDIFLLLAIEGILLTTLGLAVGLALLACLSALAAPWLMRAYGIAIQPLALSASGLWSLFSIWMTGLAASLIPGWRAYRLSLADGLQPRL